MTAIGTRGTSHWLACAAVRSPASAGRTLTSRSGLCESARRESMSGAGALDQDEAKTVSAGRILPIPDALLAELTAAKARQAAEKLARGEAYANLGYVVCNSTYQVLAPPVADLIDARH
jgi:hypothetical protein